MRYGQTVTDHELDAGFLKSFLNSDFDRLPNLLRNFYFLPTVRLFAYSEHKEREP
jgi:hypothetical protein